MEVRFVDHHYAGMRESGVVTEIVKNVVADLVKRNVEFGGVEGLRLVRERRHSGDAFHFLQQSSRVIGDAAPRRRERREKRDLHFINSIENVPTASGTRTKAGVRAASLRKYISKLTSDCAPLTDTLRRSASTELSATLIICVPANSMR